MQMLLSQKTDPEILALVEPMMDNLMEASNDIDYERHIRDFTPRLKALVSPEGLRKMCTSVQTLYGKYGRRELVKIYRRDDSVAVLWTQYHERSENEFVASIVVIEDKDGNCLIDHALIY